MTLTDTEEFVILFCLGSFGVVCCFLLFLVWNCTERTILFHYEKTKRSRSCRNRLAFANMFRREQFRVQVERTSPSSEQIGTHPLPSYEEAIALDTHSSPSSIEETVPSYEDAVAAAPCGTETLPTYIEAVMSIKDLK